MTAVIVSLNLLRAVKGVQKDNKTIGDFLTLSFIGNKLHVSLIGEDVRNAQLHVRDRNQSRLLARAARVADTHQHVCDRVVDYHDDLVIPGIFPSFANSRKQMRQRSKSRI